MKSKKLFAILTLVAFMMTLVPVAAFAALDGTYSAAASTVSPSSTSLSVYSDTDDLAKITVTFKGGSPVRTLASPATVDFYVTSDRDAVEGYVVGGDGTKHVFTTSLYGPSGQFFDDIPVDANGKVYIYAGSGVSGSFKISVYNGDPDVEGLLIGSTNISVSLGEGAITFTADNEDDALGAFPEESTTPYTTRAATVGDGINLKAVVEDGGVGLEDVEVIFQARYEGGSWYTIATELTDEDGEAEYYFEETKAGTWEYRAKTADDTSGVVQFYIAPAATKTIEPKTADGTKIALKEVNNIDFYVKDKFGNLIKSFNDYNSYDVAVASAPEGSKFEDYSWSNPTSGDILTVDDREADGILRVKFKPDKEGKYVIKVRDTVETRVAASIEVEAVKFDKAVGMKLKVENIFGKETNVLTRVYSTDTYGTESNLKAGTLVVTLVNAAGVELPTTSDLTFGSSDTSKVDFISTSAGDIRVKANAIGTYTLTAYYAKDNVLGTYELQVVGGPAAIKATPVVNGKNATVTLQYVDTNGNNTWVIPKSGGVPTGAAPDESYRLILPAGVTASNVKNIKETGSGSFELTAAASGTYPITVIANNTGMTSTFNVAFDVATEKPVSKVVTMFIGAPGYMDGTNAKVTDVAPFIVDGRTFVAVRPVAEAFGAEIGWNEATQTVTLTTANTTVTIVIGSNTITVVKDGVTSTVTADVAAFIKDGRTVLPFRAVGEAFGATVNYDAATQAVTYEI